MDCHGRMLAHILLHESDGIIGMSWNCPSFLVEDSSESDTDSDDYSPPQGELVFIFGGKKVKTIAQVTYSWCVVHFQIILLPGRRE